MTHHAMGAYWSAIAVTGAWLATVALLVYRRVRRLRAKRAAYLARRPTATLVECHSDARGVYWTAQLTPHGMRVLGRP